MKLFYDRIDWFQHKRWCVLSTYCFTQSLTGHHHNTLITGKIIRIIHISWANDFLSIVCVVLCSNTIKLISKQQQKYSTHVLFLWEISNLHSRRLYEFAWKCVELLTTQPSLWTYIHLAQSISDNGSSKNDYMLPSSGENLTMLSKRLTFQINAWTSHSPVHMTVHVLVGTHALQVTSIHTFTVWSSTSLKHFVL